MVLAGNNAKRLFSVNYTTKLHTIDYQCLTCFRVFGTLGLFGGTSSQSPDFFRILNFHYLNICSLKFAFHNEVNNLFFSTGLGDIAKQLLKGSVHYTFNSLSFKSKQKHLSN